MFTHHYIKGTLYVDMLILKCNLSEVIKMLSKNTNKIIKNSKVLKKTKPVLFPSRILPCKHKCL